MLAGAFDECECERLCLLCLDDESRLIDFIVVADGTRKNVTFNAAEIVRMAVVSGATHVVLAHNHVDGAVKPSTEDEYCTDWLVNELAHTAITVEEHVIYAGGELYPFIHSKMRYLEKTNEKNRPRARRRCR